MSVCGKCVWFVRVVSVCGSCGWLVCVVSVCDECVMSVCCECVEGGLVLGVIEKVYIERPTALNLINPAHEHPWVSIVGHTSASSALLV